MKAVIALGSKCLIWIGVVLLIACTREGPMDDKFLQEFRQKFDAIKQGDSLKIDAIPAGDWTELFVFGPYTPEEEITSNMRPRNASPLKLERISERDDINLLVFVSTTDVKLSVAVPRAIADFKLPKGMRSLTREKAVFQKSGKAELVVQESAR